MGLLDLRPVDRPHSSASSYAPRKPLPTPPEPEPEELRAELQTLSRLEELLDKLGADPKAVQRGELMKQIITVKARDNVAMLLGRVPEACRPRALAAMLSEDSIPKEFTMTMASSSRSAHDDAALKGHDQWGTSHHRTKDVYHAQREAFFQQLVTLRK